MSSASIDQIQQKLFARTDLPPLEPGKKIHDIKLTEQIKGLNVHEYVKASLHLANDDIEGCHLIAQDHEGEATGDLLHATLHRREGDYWNSKYWWNRVKSHPLIPSKDLAKKFVDQCEKSASTGGSEENALREKQWEELKGIVVWCREKYT